MLRSDAFSYVDVLTKAADASWLRESAISNNIANADTPGYKRQDVEFQSVLNRRLHATGANNLDAAVKKVDTKHLNGYNYTDYAGYSYRLDENNVDIETESVELASEQLNYTTLTKGLSSEFQRFKAVIK